MYYLSWDQRHTITLELFGSIAGAHLDIVTRYNSPRPYTRAPSGSGVLPEGTEVTPNNARMRDIFLMDTRVSRAWPIRWWGNDSQLILFLDVRNITDRKNVDWIASDGQIGGELRDPGAYRIGRRMRIGIEVRF